MKKVYFPNMVPNRRLTRPRILLLGGLLGLGVFLLISQINEATQADLLDAIGTQPAQAQEKLPANANLKEENPADNTQVTINAQKKIDDKVQEGVTSQASVSLQQRKAKEDELEFRESKLGEIKNEITDTLTTMRRLQNNLDIKLKEQRSDNMNVRDQRLAKLIKIVNSMRAEEAARVLPAMEEDLAVKILASLSGAKASKIMGGLPPEKAAVLSAKMVQLKPDVRLKYIMKNWKQMVEEEDNRGKAQSNQE